MKDTGSDTVIRHSPSRGTGSPDIWGLYEADTGSVQYVCACPSTRQAALIDIVLNFAPANAGRGGARAGPPRGPGRRVDPRHASACRSPDGRRLSGEALLEGALVLASGVMLLGLGLLRLGWLANLMSHPVVSGFITASAIIIATGQLRHLLGIEGSGETLPVLLASLWQALPEVNLPTLVLGALGAGSAVVDALGAGAPAPPGRAARLSGAHGRPRGADAGRRREHPGRLAARP